MSDFKFVNYDPVVIRSELEKAYVNIFGSKVEQGDPMADFLDYITFIFCLILSSIDNSGKMNLLRFSKGKYLEAIAENVGESREGAKGALTTIRYTFSKTFDGVVVIPKGHKTEAFGLYFETVNDSELRVGQKEIDIECQCSTDGIVGNGIGIGEIINIVDPIAYLQKVSNLTETAGGVDVESDDSLREKTRTNPASKSVAGPEAAYKYHTKNAHHGIVDVHIETVKGTGVVKVYPLLEAGVIPSQEILNIVSSALNAKEVRPLTDYVEPTKPGVVSYSIDLTYYIVDDSSINEVEIRAEIETAVENYIKWQCEKLGRDINPDRLTALIVAAGAKRVEITSPVRVNIDKTQVASMATKNIKYGGKEIE